MSGVKWLYISSDYKIYKVSQPKDRVFKAVKELAGQDVMQVMLAYETSVRKPSRLFHIEFCRISLNPDGTYNLNDSERVGVWHNANHFLNADPQRLAEREGQFVLPIAPSIPSSKEKLVLYDYLKKHFPLLAKDAPTLVEKTIRIGNQLHKERIEMIKKAKLLRERKI